MATLNYSFSLVTFLLSSSLLFILFSCFLMKSSIAETAIDSHYYTLEISSLLPASVCTPSTTKGSNKRQSTLQVFHSHGPCSYQAGKNKTTTTPSLAEVLSDDQARVESIQARINPNKIKNTSSNSSNLKDEKTNLPVQHGLSLGTKNYVVTIGLGTPMRTLSLAIDTGSDLTWTQCYPCILPCYRQQDPIFNSSESSSYSDVSCDSAQCSEIRAATGQRHQCYEGTCMYGVIYADGSFSGGALSEDKLTLTASDVFQSFYFGCGQFNSGMFGQTAGLLGLGRNPLSLVSQTAHKYGKYFSYCLPSTSSSTGHLTLCKNNGAPPNVEFTPFANNHGTSLYYIDIVSIIVKGRQLPISQSVLAGGIIDSGAVITRLPRAAYGQLRAAFQEEMAGYPRAAAYSILDTCYDFSGYKTYTVPTISFIFRGGVKVDLHHSGVLITNSETQACLAFAENDEGDWAIFGNTQQKTFEVVYDVAGGNLGFAPNGCL